MMSNTALTSTAGYFYWVVAARASSAHAVGIAAAMLSAMNLMCLIGTLGIGPTLSQRLSRADEAGWSGLVNLAVFGGGISGMIMGAIGVFVLPELSGRFQLAGTVAYAPLLVLGIGVLTIANLLDYIFIAHRAAHHVLTRGIIFGTVKAAALVALLWLIGPHSVAAIVYSWVLGALMTSAVTVCVLMPRLGHAHHWTPRGIGRTYWSMARDLLLNHAIGLSAVMVPTLMPVIVVTRGSAEDNAYFYIAWLIAGMVLTVSASVSGSMLAEGAHDPRRLMSQVRSSAILISALLACPVLFLLVLGRQVLALFGPAYAAHSYVPLLLFLVVAVPDAMTNIYVTVLRVRGDHHIGALVNFLMSVSTLTLAWVLLPRMGLVAVGWSWAAGQAIGVVFMGIAIGVRGLRRPGLLAAEPGGLE